MKQYQAEQSRIKRAKAPATQKRRAVAKKRRRTVKRTRRFEWGQLSAGLSQRLVRERMRLPTLPTLPMPSRWILGSGWHVSKVLSLLGLVSVCYALFWIHTDDRFFLYEEDVRFQQLSYLDPDELFDVADVKGWNVFWLRPNSVRDTLMRYPYIADAQVSVALPGTLVAEVTEARPTALWMTDDGPKWLMRDGAALAVRDESGNQLLQILDGPQDANAIGLAHGAAIDSGILESALHLAERFVGLESLTYNKDIGLNFPLVDSNYWIYWGDGQDVGAQDDQFGGCPTDFAEWRSNRPSDRFTVY